MNIASESRAQAFITDDLPRWSKHSLCVYSVVAWVKRLSHFLASVVSAASLRGKDHTMVTLTSNSPLPLHPRPSKRKGCFPIRINGGEKDGSKSYRTYSMARSKSRTFPLSSTRRNNLKSKTPGLFGTEMLVFPIAQKYRKCSMVCWFILVCERTGEVLVIAKKMMMETSHVAKIVLSFLSNFYFF